MLSYAVIVSYIRTATVGEYPFEKISSTIFFQTLEFTCRTPALSQKKTHINLDASK